MATRGRPNHRRLSAVEGLGRPAAAREPLISLSGAALQRAEGTPLQLVGLGATGGVYTVRRKAGAWLDWHYLP